MPQEMTGMKRDLIALIALLLWSVSCLPTPTPLPAAAMTPTPLPRSSETPIPTATTTSSPTVTLTLAPTPTHTPTSTPTLVPTITPQPTATAMPTRPPAGVPDPKATAADQLDAALSQMATTLGLAKENIQLCYYTLRGRGVQEDTMVYAVAGYTTAEASRQTRHAVPVLVALPTPNGGWNWQRVGLRVLGDATGVEIGMYMDTTAENLLDNDANFALLTSGWGASTQPNSPDAISFAHEDYHLGLAQRHGITHGRIMHLIFGHRDIPNWMQEGVRNGTMGRDQVIHYMRSYITAMVTRYSERGINQFVVVNEPYRPDDWYAKVIGKEYIEIAFQAARDADPNAILFVNETDNHTPKTSYTLNTKLVLERLKQSGFDMRKIAVGVQAHIWQNQWTPPPLEGDVIAALRSYHDYYGVDVYITEMDVNMKLFKGDRDARLKAQAEIYASFIRAALKSGVVKGIGFWSPIDQVSWYVFPALDPDGSPDSVATMWEGQPTDSTNPNIHPYVVWPKPSYYAVVEELFQHLLEQN